MVPSRVQKTPANCTSLDKYSEHLIYGPHVQYINSEKALNAGYSLNTGVLDVPL